jgi:vitamin B12 transporter
MEDVLIMFASLRCRSAPLFAAACFSLVLALPAFAQTDATVTVTATRVPVRVSDVVAEITVLDRSDLDRATGRTLAEFLAQQPGLQFSSNGGLGKTASLFMRGLEARHTLLLVDGVRVGSATVGTPSLDNLPLEGVERIEIVRGPMSSLYGNGAMGGVIQVFTRKGTPGLVGNGKLTAGSNGYGQAAGGLRFGGGTIDGAVQLQHTRNDGQSATNPREPFGQYNPDRDGFRQDAGSVRLGWQLAPDWKLDALALQSRGTTQLDDGPGADAKARLTNSIVSLAAAGRVTDAWRTRVGVSTSTDGYDTLSSASPFASLGLIESRLRQISWENTVPTPIGTALLLAERQHEKVYRPGTPFVLSERDIDGLALGLNGAAGPQVWQASLRRDRNSQFGSANTGAAGYAYALTPALRLGASYGTSFVAPSFNQLYYPGFGNPLLVPETGKHTELSARWTAGEHSVRAAYFDNRYRGFITSGPLPVNLPRARIDGVSLSYEGRWRDLALSASADHVDPRNDTAGSANFGKKLPRRAQEALRLGGDWAGGPWSAGATLSAFSHRFDDTANTTRLGGYGTLDLRAEWAWSRDLKFGLKLNNAGNKRYETALGYDQPGREAFVTASYTVK